MLPLFPVYCCGIRLKDLSVKDRSTFLAPDLLNELRCRLWPLVLFLPDLINVFHEHTSVEDFSLLLHLLLRAKEEVN